MDKKKKKKVKSKQKPVRRPKKKVARPQTNGAETPDNTGPAPVPKGGPTITQRMRDREQIEKVKAAAKRAGMSMNTWVAEVLEKAAEAQA